MTGITRKQAAEALAAYFQSSPRHKGGTYDAYTIMDPDGKVWKIMSDASIRGECRVNGSYSPSTDTRYRVELVTPKLTYEELPKFQECIRQLRHAGAKVNGSCGLHVHVDGANHNRQSVKNLLSIMYAKEDILFKALQVNEARASRWCQKVREPMLSHVRQLSAEETQDFSRQRQLWYDGVDGGAEHYNWTRYYALNVHSLFYRGTIEWRCFKATPHNGCKRTVLPANDHQQDGLILH